MKKILLALCMLLGHSLSAQVLTQEEIEDTFVLTFGEIPSNGKEWMQLADSIKSAYPLDINKQITFTHVIDVPNKNKNDIFIAAQSWFTASFNDGKSVMQTADKEAGVILAKGYLAGVGHREGFSKSVTVSAYVMIRLDVKDEKVRLITTIQEYEMKQSTGVGMAIMGGLSGNSVTNNAHFSIVPQNGYPFSTDKKYKSYKRETSIGYASSIAYSILLKNKVEAALRVGITGTDNSDW